MTYSMGCLNCSKQFEMYPSQPRGPYCSDDCRNQYRERALKAVAGQRDRLRSAIADAIGILTGGDEDRPIEHYIDEREDDCQQIMTAAVQRLKRALQGA